MKEGWTKKTLQEVCVLQRGFDLPKQQRIPGNYPLISSSGRIDSHTQSKVKGPGVVTGRSGSIGSVFYIDDDFFPLNTTLYVKDFCGNDHRFIYYLLKTFDLKRFASGAGVPTLNRNNVHTEVTHIPPLSEQKRIVAILDEAFAGISQAIANAERNLNNSRDLLHDSYKYIFNKITSGKYKRTTVSDIANTEKGSIRTGPFGSQLLHSEFTDEGIAVLGIDNAVNNIFSWDKRRFITEDKYRELSRYTVKPDDVIITIMGTCGRCAIVPSDIPPAINSKHLCCITLDKGKCIPEFLHSYFLYHPTAKQYLVSRAKGSIMAGLNMGIISELPVHLPSLAQQKDIIKRFSSLSTGITHLETIYQQKLAALAELKQSILQKAFTGQLTDNLPL